MQKPEITSTAAPTMITPKWPAPSNVLAASTTRIGGGSLGAFAGFNLGTHVGDCLEQVEVNRSLLVKHLELPAAPVWLEQVHGNEVLYVDAVTNDSGTPGIENQPAPPVADACWTDQPDIVLAIMTADCLPVLLASRCGTVVAAIHGGWRGLATGILQKTVAMLPVSANELIAWMGPAIGPVNFEVGNEVREAFVNKSPVFSGCFKASAVDREKCYADIFAIAELSLQEAGVSNIESDRVCTVSDEHLFFSHRRDNGKSGRMATLVWRT